MVSHPVEELIEALYLDDRILKKNVFITLHCPGKKTLILFK